VLCDLSTREGPVARDATSTFGSGCCHVLVVIFFSRILKISIDFGVLPDCFNVRPRFGLLSLLSDVALEERKTHPIIATK
jgi:hypothetical protein